MWRIYGIWNWSWSVGNGKEGKYAVMGWDIFWGLIYWTVDGYGLYHDMLYVGYRELKDDGYWWVEDTYVVVG